MGRRFLFCAVFWPLFKLIILMPCSHVSDGHSIMMIFMLKNINICRSTCCRHIASLDIRLILLQPLPIFIFVISPPTLPLRSFHHAWPRTARLVAFIRLIYNQKILSYLIINRKISKAAFGISKSIMILRMRWTFMLRQIPPPYLIPVCFSTASAMRRLLAASMLIEMIAGKRRRISYIR